jgi:hypothetical protein
MGDEESGGALAITSHFFEFMEEPEFERGGAATRFAWELKDRTRYYIVFSTSAGLCRYVLGDIVETCGFFGGVPRIRFVRKGGASSNLAGEKLEEVHVNDAVGQALAGTGLLATFFTLVPDWSGSTPGYALHLEPATPATSEMLEALRRAVEDGLCRTCFDYARLRGSAQLRAVSLKVLAQGSYDRVRQSRVQDGSAEAQLKTAHLVADAATLPEFLR